MLRRHADAAEDDDGASPDPVHDPAETLWPTTLQARLAAAARGYLPDAHPQLPDGDVGEEGGGRRGSGAEDEADDEEPPQVPVPHE